jgi:hypothetical protein
MWQYLVEHAKDYGFLGPIVGIVGLLLGAGGAILFGWSRALDTWKPPTDTFPKGLEKVVGMLCAVGLFVIWILAEPKNGPAYLRFAVYAAVVSLVAFLIYVAFWAYCGRFRKPQVGGNNKPTREDVIWGGFWLWKQIRASVGPNNPVESILAGNLFDRSKVWPPFSLTMSAVITAFVLMTLLVAGTLALSTAAASVQVALTGKPAREIVSTLQVSGLTSPVDTNAPPNKEATSPSSEERTNAPTN